MPSGGVVPSAPLALLTAMLLLGGRDDLGCAGAKSPAPAPPRHEDVRADSLKIDGFEAEFGAVTQIGSSNYTGVDGHFWMPQPLFRAAAAMDSELLVSVAIHGDGADCPPPDRPHQACEEGLRQGPAAGAPWAVVPGGVSPGSSLIRVNGSVTRGFAGLWLNSSTNTSGQAFFQDFNEHGSYLRKGDATITGMPPMLGISYLQSTASAVITTGPDKGLALTQFYGYLKNAPATGGCKAAHPWELPYCYSIITLASRDQGLNWQFRSLINWDGEKAKMPAVVEGPCEPSLVVLPDGKTLLSVFRLQSNKNLWMSISSNAGATFQTAQETNAWAVFPQARTLGNGALALTAGRPGIGLWVTDGRGKIDPLGWRFYNLAAEHNKIVSDQTLQFGPPEVAISNASSPTSMPVMTKAYSGLEVQGCDGDSCKLTVSYDRVCNGNAGPPGPHGSKDHAFSMTFDVKPAKTDDDGLGTPLPAEYNCSSCSGNWSVNQPLVVPSPGCKTIQAALDCAPDGRQLSDGRLAIHVVPGVYREKLTVGATKGPLLLQGLSATADGVTIAWDDADKAAGVGKPGCRGANRTSDNAGGEWASQTLRVDSDDFMLANVTVLNDACGFEGGARNFALMVNGDRVGLDHCRVYGQHDTFYTGLQRVHIKDSWINGSTDFIFGAGTAVFDGCEIVAAGGHITAHKGFATDQNGQASCGDSSCSTYLIRNSRLPAARHKATADLGRAWRSRATVIYESVWMDSHINPQGWGTTMSGCHATATVCPNITYAEYNSSGPGANPKRRVAWSKQLSATGMERFAVSKVLNGWVPSSSVAAKIDDEVANCSLPCDIYAAGGTPCVAAHSIVRPLFASYTGPLFTVRRPVDNATLDISAQNGYADTATQDQLCGFSHNLHCTLHRIFDQSPHANHLDPTSLGSRRAPGRKVDAGVPLYRSSRRRVGGRIVYAAVFDAGMGYRNVNTSGVATGDAPESMYAVLGGDRYNDHCCFDYGNAEMHLGESFLQQGDEILWQLQ